MDLITETDSALSFHMQKFAFLTETLVAHHGSAVLPLAADRQGTSFNATLSDSPGFSAWMEQINDGRDFRDYVLDFSGKVPKTNRYSDPQNVEITPLSSVMYRLLRH